MTAALAGIAACALIGGTIISSWKWREAEKNRAIAEHRYLALRDFAHNTVAAMDYNIGTPGTEGRIASAVIRQLGQLSREGVQDDELQLEIAAACERLGDTQGYPGGPNLGDTASAMDNYRKAHAILLAQWQAHPERRRGVLFMESFKRLSKLTPDARAACEFVSKGLAIGSELIVQYPDDGGLKLRTASLYSSQGQTAAALRSASESLTLRRNQALRDSDNIPAQRNYMQSLNRVGNLLLAAQQDPGVADGLFREAVSVGERLRKQARSNSSINAHLARGYSGQADVQIRRHHRDAALALMRRSVELFREAHRLAPGDRRISGDAAAAERSLEILSQ